MARVMGLVMAMVMVMVRVGDTVRVRDMGGTVVMAMVLVMVGIPEHYYETL
jgi:hypothetical protein